MFAASVIVSTDSATRSSISTPFPDEGIFNYSILEFIISPYNTQSAFGNFHLEVKLNRVGRGLCSSNLMGK